MATSPVSSSSSAGFFPAPPPTVWQRSADRIKEGDIGGATSADACTDSATREHVLLAHLPLVRFVARRIHERLPKHVELEDLVSAGTLGLIDAFNKFDAGKNVQFRSYAQFRIRGAILDSLRTLDWASRELRRKGRTIEEAMRKLTQKLGQRPSDSEVATEIGMSLLAYQQLIGELKSLEIGSLQETRTEDSFDEDLMYLPTPPEEDPLFRCMKGEASARLCDAVSALPERDARVLALYYVEEMTLKEIGLVLGVVESRVSQIRAAAVNSLRVRMGQTVVQDIRSGGRLTKTQSAIPAVLVQRNAVSNQGSLSRIPAR